MQCIPVIVSEDSYDLFIILEEENVVRMKAYDPPEILTTALPTECLARKVNNIVLMYATDRDLTAVIAACAVGDVRTALRILSRGYQWRPDRGERHLTDDYETNSGD